MAERDFNLEMTGEQVKDALQQLEYRVAEGWAVGEHDGVPVTSGSPYYHNNSAWWAQQAGLSATAAASSAATAEQEVEEGIRQGIVGAYVQESATPGAVVTFDDGADNIPLKDLKVNLAIVQPGTGDPAPDNIRPILPVTEVNVTRTGKNLLFKTISKAIINTNGSISNNASYDIVCAKVKAGQNYIISVNGVALNANIAFYSAEPEVGAVALGDRTLATGGQFTAEINGYVGILIAVGRLGVQLELGSTATAYEPYQIMQAKEVNIGIQQWDEEWEVGTINNDTGVPEADSNNIRSKNFCPCLPNTDYYVKGSVAMRIYWYASDQSFISGSSVNVSGGVVTSPATAAYFKIRTTTSYGSTYLEDISVNFPSTETDYYAYTGQQGVYGGDADITAGVLIARYKKIVLDGTENWVECVGAPDIYAINSAAYLDGRVQVVGMRIAGYCTHAPSSIHSDHYCIDGALTPNSTIGSYLNAHGMQGTDFNWGQTFATTDAWKAYLAAQAAAGTPVTYIYELATPLTIQLDPTAINTLRGDNVIFADCGDITNCEYRADLKMYIDKVVGA